jgi:hypothetical protein
MRAFIIRSFGTKSEIDFDAVEAKLIAPALAAVGVAGRTTLDILRAGNIRIDMFQRLLTADLVVADVSIANANVFYELGIRHALREKRTLMIRCEADKYPFDLQTDRYFTYDRARPEASLDGLIAALRQTIDSSTGDSPVFQLLPNLAEQERSRFLAVPLDFREEAERACQAGDVGDLELLADEVKGLEWESEGLRIVGRFLYDLRAWPSACEIWGAVRQLDPLDLEANIKLGTIYLKMGDLTRSDQALNRALTREGLTSRDRAEIHSLLGSNAKARWLEEWGAAPEPHARALRSAYLFEARGAYEEGFREDLNHFYSGLNALAMLRVIDELAEAAPQEWEARFETSEEARYERDAIRARIEKLCAAVAVSLAAEEERLRRAGRKDRWVDVSQADLCLLSSNKPLRVAALYTDALAGAPPLLKDSARRQVLIYKALGILAENVAAALGVFEGVAAPSGAVASGAAASGVVASGVVASGVAASGAGAAGSSGAAPSRPVAPAANGEQGRVLLVTGHRIDEPGRAKPRFPADREATARQAIRDAVQREMSLPGGVALGIAGGASGGDILFHEVCAELGIPTELYLALPVDEYVRKSVQSAGAGWVERFRNLCEARPPRILARTSEQAGEELPRWLREKPDYGIWQRNSLWTLHHALASGSRRVTLVALWNGEAGDGPGGTADLVQKATERGAKTIILNTGALFAADEAGKGTGTGTGTGVGTGTSAGKAADDAAAAALPQEVTADRKVTAVDSTMTVIQRTSPADPGESFDVFLSYNRADQAAVEGIAQQLKKLGLNPWYDRWCLRPGLPWMEEIEQQIERIRSAAVFIGQEGVGPWQSIEQESLLREFRKRRCPVIPVLLADSGEAPKLPVFLEGMTWVDLGRDPDPMGSLVWGITGKRNPAERAEEPDESGPEAQKP